MKNQIKKLKPLTIIILLPLFIGCSTAKSSSMAHLTMKNDYCISNITSDFTEIKSSFNNPDSLFAGNKDLNTHFTKNEIIVANAVGSIAILQKLISNLNDTSADAKLNNIALRQQLLEQTFRVKSVFDELNSEINCESERTKRAATYLDGYEKKRTTNLTIAAILTGSATSIAPLVIKDNKSQNAATIIGAVASAYLGAKLLYSGNKKVKFTYDRNLLSDVWNEPKISTQYPEFIWLLMNLKELNTGSMELSMQQNIKNRWLNIELNGTNEKTLDLIFKKGGDYTEDDLQTRAILLNQLEASMRLLNSNIQSYLSSIQRKLERKN